MRLRDIVQINHQGLIADAVDLDMRHDPSKNLPLCKGFVFNYNAQNPKRSTLGVLHALRNSFHSSSHPNIHLMVKDFGKGKSHFAVMVTNFFSQSGDSEAVQGILHQISFVTEQTKTVYEDLKAYKNRCKPHLVICIRGEKGIDLKKMFLQSVKESLESVGRSNSLAHQLIEAPLNYLQSLDTSEQEIAENFLAQNKFDGDLGTLIELLEEDNYDYIPLVTDLSRQVEGKGVPLNFEADLDIEAILEELIRDLCTGSDRPFEGILIILDEFNAYLRTWLKNSAAAGGLALQNITSVCERNTGKIALLCLAQVRPSQDKQLSHLDRKHYERFTTRIEKAPSTYDPEASLELVLDNLLKQTNDQNWQQFHSTWGNTLTAESRIAYDRYITAYKATSHRWSFQDFHKHLGLGCYPLHPLTAYLLCNLDFTQGRTAIQFIKEEAAKFIDKSEAVVEGKPAFIHAVTLLDFFESNFAQQSIYLDYKKAYDSIASTANDDEKIALKAIALYYLSGEKLTKPVNENHEEILSVMTGFSVSKMKKVLQKLTSEYQVIYHNAGNNAYRFYSGFSIADLRRKIEEDIEEKTPKLTTILDFCRQNMSQYLGSSTVKATKFISQKRLNEEEWQFERQIYSIDSFERVLLSERFIRDIKERGQIAYFIGEYDQDLESLEREADTILSKSPKAIQNRVIIAIPKRGTRDLGRTFLMKEELRKANIAEKQEFGAAYVELSKELDEEINNELTDLFDGCVYSCHIMRNIPLAERNNLDSIASKMLEELYPYVPPIEGQDKLKEKSTAGSGIVSYATRQLLGDDLKEPFPNQGYKTLIETVFEKRWGLLQRGTPYKVQIPRDRSVREAWDRISVLTDIGDRNEKSIEIRHVWETLSDAPFGYNNLTFTMLFVAWLAYHRNEVELEGGFGIPKKKSDRVTNKRAPLHDWMETNILEKAKDFVQDWIVQGKNKLVRRKPLIVTIPDSVDYDQAQVILQNVIESQRQGGALLQDPDFARRHQQLQQGIHEIEQWLKPSQGAEQVLQQNSNLEDLAKFYPLLETSPPLTIAPGKVTVRVTERQRELWTQTKQDLRDRLENLVEEYEQKVKSFEIVDAGYSCKAEIQQKIQALSNILPQRFIDRLGDAVQVSDQRIAELKQQEDVHNKLEEIRGWYQTLGTQTTQRQYQTLQDRIVKLSQEIPIIQAESEYQQIVDDLEKAQDRLTSKISYWQDRFSPDISKAEALQLTEEINRELVRFDNQNSRQQLEELTAQIKNKILEIEGEASEEEALQSILKQADQKVKSIQSLKNLNDAMQVYDELSKLLLPTTSKIQNISHYQAHLTQAQGSGRQSIEQKFDQLFQTCERQLKNPDDYKRLKNYLQLACQLITQHSEFTVLQVRLQEAEQKLEQSSLILKHNLEDDRIKRQIEQFNLQAGNTILRCEEIIQELENLRAQLHYPEQYQKLLDKQIRAFETKKAEYKERLDEVEHNLAKIDQLAQVQRFRSELAKLEFICKDSSEYSRYVSLQEQLQLLNEDCDRVQKLENTYHEILSIVQCDALLEDMQSEINTLNYQDRFQKRIENLQNKIEQHRQKLIDLIDKFRQSLINVTSSQEAQQLQTKIGNKSKQYSGSGYEEAYETLVIQINHLVQILSLQEAQLAETLQDCQTELDRLTAWEAKQDQISDFIQDKLKRLRQELIQTQKNIQLRQCSAAQNWLSNLNTRINHIETLAEPEERLEEAYRLLKTIRSERSQHEDFLEESEKEELREIIKRCNNIRNRDTESKIVTLFQELPGDKRLELYQQLSAYLESTTEVF